MAAHPKGRHPGLGVLALALLAIPGFGLGVLAGVAWEDPGLLFGHLVGRSVDVPWGQVAAEEARPVKAQPEAVAKAAPEPLPDVSAPAAPAAKPAPPPPAATRMRPEVLSPSTSARFAVQVGAFSESRAAEGLVESLREKGFEAYVSPSPKPGGARWRVRVGPLPTREEADGVASRLKAEEKLPTWVLDENAV